MVTVTVFVIIVSQGSFVDNEMCIKTLGFWRWEVSLSLHQTTHSNKHNNLFSFFPCLSYFLISFVLYLVWSWVLSS